MSDALGTHSGSSGSPRADVAYDITVEQEGEPIAYVRAGSGPVVATALHAGHHVRSGLLSKMRLTDDERLREEDPHTALFAPDDVNLISAARSRFEVDLNRSRDMAVYRVPQQAWGLDVWVTPLDPGDVDASLAVYDRVYELLHESLSAKLAEHPFVLVLDLHSYNHRRPGPKAPAEAAEANPEINLGTARIDRSRWAAVVEAFMSSLSDQGFDVRENVKFGGGHFAEWVGAAFPGRACVLSIEFKKTFMDEWSGSVDLEHVSRNRRALQIALPTLLESLAVGR